VAVLSCTLCSWPTVVRRAEVEQLGDAGRADRVPNVTAGIRRRQERSRPNHVTCGGRSSCQRRCASIARVDDKGIPTGPQRSSLEGAVNGAQKERRFHVPVAGRVQSVPVAAEIHRRTLRSSAPVGARSCQMAEFRQTAQGRQKEILEPRTMRSNQYGPPRRSTQRHSTFGRSS